MKQVRLSSTVNPSGFETTAQFYAGETISSLYPVGDEILIEAGTEEVPVTVTVDLEDATEYLAKIEATNENGTVESANTEFNTGDHNVEGLPIVGEVIVEVLES